MSAYDTLHFIRHLCIDKNETVVQDDLKCAFLPLEIAAFHNSNVESSSDLKWIIGVITPNQTAW